MVIYDEEYCSYFPKLHLTLVYKVLVWKDTEYVEENNFKYSSVGDYDKDWSNIGEYIKEFEKGK